MSTLIEHPVILAASATSLLLSSAGALLWRLTLEFDRGWRRAEEAPPEPQEWAACEEHRPTARQPETTTIATEERSKEDRPLALA